MIQEPISRRQQGKLQRRERLYDAALALFRSQGYEATTVDQITRQAGLAKGTFFNYFPTKDAVLRYMGAREVGRLGSAIMSSNNGTHSSVAKLKRLLSTLAASLQTDRELVCLIFRRGISVPDLLAGDAGGFSLQPLTSLLLRQSQRTGEINPDLDPDMLATVLDALYLQQVVRWCEGKDQFDLGERLNAIVDLLLVGATA